MITAKKVLFSFIVFLLLVSISVLVYLSVGQYMERGKLGRGVEKSAVHASSSIEQILSDKRKTVTEFSKNSVIKPNAISSVTETALRSFCRENNYFLWASVTNTDGVVIASSSEGRVDEEYGDNDAFKQAIQGEDGMTDVLAEGEDIAVVHFSSPLYAQDKIVGTLMVALDGQGLNNVLRKAQVDKKGTEILVDRDGQVIASANESDVFKLSLADYRVSQTTISGVSGFVLGKDTKGQGVLFGYAPTNAQEQWTVLVSVPFAGGRNAEIFGFSATLLLLILLASVLSGRSVFFPEAEQSGQIVASDGADLGVTAVVGAAEAVTGLEHAKALERSDMPTSTEKGKSSGVAESESNMQGTRAKELVDKIIEDAVLSGTSDIHIDPSEEGASIRYRVDGVLSSAGTIPRDLLQAVTSRIKTVAGLDKTGRRSSEETIKLSIGREEARLTISAFPTVLGEKFVLKILDMGFVSYLLEDLGLGEKDLLRFDELLQKPSGLVLIVGPGGSGRTTTLYSAINAIKTVEKSVITLEDPVEHRLKGVNQGQINANAGVTFAIGLRLILEQDSDVIMVGEIRDSETAKLAIQAALTGRLVLSSLKVEDAASALADLLEMGIDPSSVASSLSGIVVQRLVRVICPHCRVEYTPSRELVNSVGWADRGLRFYRGRGCPKCSNTGYKGRTGLFEILAVDQKIRELVTSRTTTEAIRVFVEKNQSRTLADDGFDKVSRGITTLDEALKAIRLDQHVAPLTARK